METKKFKPFDKVLVREDIFPKWTCGYYSHYDVDEEKHVTTVLTKVDDKDILPYEGNEELVGTTNSPDEEVRLEEGEWIMCAAGPYDHATDWILRQFDQTRENIFLVVNGGYWSFTIRFRDFDPSNMDETKKHILCVKNWKIIRYKG